MKYILVKEINKEKVFRRKCDFDVEVTIDVHKALKENYKSFIFFTGDGDFEPLYQLLIENGKQVVVIFARKHLGREIYQVKRGVFLKTIDDLETDLFG